MNLAVELEYIDTMEPTHRSPVSTRLRARRIARDVNPLFQHDCDRCCFLGRLDRLDLYVCAGATGALVARFSDEPEDSGSLGRFAPPGTPYAFALELVKRQEVTPGCTPDAFVTVK